jgi:hypothetical protein
MYMKLNNKKQKARETKDKKKKREQRQLKQKGIIINVGNVTGSRRSRNRKNTIQQSRPSDKLGPSYIEALKGDNKDVLAQLNRQEAETKKINEDMLAKLNKQEAETKRITDGSKHLLQMLGSQEQAYKHTLKQLTDDVRKASDIKHIYPKLIEHHIQSTPQLISEKKHKPLKPPKPTFPAAVVPPPVAPIPPPPVTKMTREQALVKAREAKALKKMLQQQQDEKDQADQEAMKANLEAQQKATQDAINA